MTKLFASIIIFYGWMIFTLPYSPSETYKYDKIVSFLPSLLYFLYPLYIKRINFDLFIQGYAITVIPLSVLLIYFKSITWSGNIESPELWVGYLYNYLGLGLHLGILFLLLHWFKKSKVLQLATFLLLFASSARGPFLFVLVLFIALNYKRAFRLNFIRHFFNYRLLVLALFPLVYFSAAILSFFNNGYLRFINLFSSFDSS
ncbi:hypothetical protein OAL28_02155, partial [bacterium]|nr:hypothetical protein [bacterium]